MKICDIFMKARAEGRGSLLYTESKELLELWGVPTASCKVARNKEEAVRAARSIGFPVVMKVFSPDVIHKTDAGGVLNDLRRRGDVINAFESIVNNMEKVRPPIRMEGVVIEKMCSGVEVMVGVTRDPQFGHVILFGMGGIFVELFKDTSFRVIPIESLDAREMIEEVKGFALLEEYRGMKGNIESLRDLLLKVSELTAQYPQIIEMDMNPVFSSPLGSIVADIRILIERQ
jgi:acetate---CoA ligase (ADP-forming) subunit beta